VSLENQTQIIDKIGGLGESIPGLNSNSIIQNLLKNSKELSTYYDSIPQDVEENVQRGMSREEAQKKSDEDIKNVTESYKKGIEKGIKDKITSMKQNYKIFKDSVDSIPEDITALISNIALPATVTAPPGAPNPIYALNLAKQGKNTLGRTLNTAISAFTQLLKDANSIGFEMPTSILNLFEKISTINTLISSIPV
jgi:polyhydroxyalkanoate synthesis regulator phasin